MKQKKGTQWVPKKQEDPGLLARLSRPTGPVDVVLDTDTYNEIDDQFAVSYLICSAEKLHFLCPVRARPGAPAGAVRRAFQKRALYRPGGRHGEKLSGDLKYSDADGKGRAEKKCIQRLDRLPAG